MKTGVPMLTAAFTSVIIIKDLVSISIHLNSGHALNVTSIDNYWKDSTDRWLFTINSFKFVYKSPIQFASNWNKIENENHIKTA